MYCCDGFRNFVSAAGDRGLGILAYENEPGRIRFVIQSRGVAFDDESKLKPVPIDVTLNVSTEIGVRFCPFCGHALNELVEDSPIFFGSLAEEHKRFLTRLPGF